MSNVVHMGRIRSEANNTTVTQDQMTMREQKSWLEDEHVPD